MRTRQTHLQPHNTAPVAVLTSISLVVAIDMQGQVLTSISLVVATDMQRHMIVGAFFHWAINTQRQLKLGSSLIITGVVPGYK